MKNFPNIVFKIAATALLTSTIACTSKPAASERNVASQAVKDDSICPGAEIKPVADFANKKAIVCDQLFPQSPYIHLPEAPHGSHFGSFIPSSGVNFVDATGKEFVILDASRQKVSWAKMPLAGTGPSHIYLYTIYDVEGDEVLFDDPIDGPNLPAIVMTGLKPVIYISGNAIDQLLVGSWEGVITPRLVPQPLVNGSPNAFSVFETAENKMIPVRIEITQLKPRPENFSKWNDSQKLKNATVNEAFGEIKNFNSSVRSSDGTCAPSLAALGDANPFLGANLPNFSIYRLGAMHTATDQVIVFVYPKGTRNLTETGMDGNQHALHPAALFLSNPELIWKEIKVNPHGIPNGFFMNHLHRVTAGGEGC